MNPNYRHYHSPTDYQRVDEFLIINHRPAKDGNWLEPIWEYMHGHPYLDASALEKIGIWEADGEIVAVANYESVLGEAFFQFHADFRFLRSQMLDHAERYLFGISKEDGRKFLNAYVNDYDTEFAELARACGYQKVDEDARPLYRLKIPNPFPPIHIADGFRLTSLAEEPDWAKLHRVMWRGFNHPGEPPMSVADLESRRKMFDTPTARRDLKIAVAAPNGDFVAFCGMFYEADAKFAYVEPVATDPDYRRLGLGKAAVLEGIRRCGALGATDAYVGNDLEFYQALGFKKDYISECWHKDWE